MIVSSRLRALHTFCPFSLPINLFILFIYFFCFPFTQPKVFVCESSVQKATTPSKRGFNSTKMRRHVMQSVILLVGTLLRKLPLLLIERITLLSSLNIVLYLLVGLSSGLQIARMPIHVSKRRNSVTRIFKMR